MSSANRSSKNTTRKLNIQDDFPPEIKRNILRSFDSPKDVKNLGETSRGFNLEAKRLQFREVDLSKLLDKLKEPGETRSIDDLLKQLSKTAVKEGRPLSYYVREIYYEKNSPTELFESTNLPSQGTRRQVETILKACDQLQVIEFRTPFEIVDWPGILRTKKQLQYLRLEQWLYRGLNYSFWSLFSALTTTSPDIKTIKLEPCKYKEERGHPDTATIERAAKASRPCRKLECLRADDEVWTIPLLKYFTIMAPNLIDVHLYLKYEKNLTELKSALEACLEKWSETLKKILICYSNNEGVPELRHRPVLPVTFPRMDKLEELVLIGVQISSASLYTLNSLKSLALAKIEHEDIVATLSSSRPSALQRLTRLTVDKPNLYRDVITRRERVVLIPWVHMHYYCPYTSSLLLYDRFFRQIPY